MTRIYLDALAVMSLQPHLQNFFIAIKDNAIDVDLIDVMKTLD